MAFKDETVEVQRRKLVDRILREGIPVSVASEAAGVSRPTAYLWLRRAEQEGILGMASRSRRPLSSPGETPPEIVEKIVRAKHEFGWGAKKLVKVLWPGDQQAPITVRTADRILKKEGLVRARGLGEPPPMRFERGEPNELWQIDFKGMPKKLGYTPLSIVDDASRFCPAFEPLTSMAGATVFNLIWELFGAYGLPEAILWDNGDCWGSRGQGPTPLEVQIMLLGIRTTHGKPYHPQTQGKVERFNRTAKDELGSALYQPTAAEARTVYEGFVDRYNWVRPHEAIGMRTPGSVYTLSPRKRPAHLPEHQIPEGAIVRKVDASGKISYQGERYRPGHGLAGHWVVIAEDEAGRFVQFAQQKIAPLNRIKV